MGSQQILLILLSVIVVAISISIAFTMFRTNAIQHARTQCVDELTYFKARIFDYYKTPYSFGGSSNGDKNWDAENISRFIGIGWDGNDKLETDIAEYTFSVSGDEVTIIADFKDEYIDYNMEYIYNPRTNIGSFSVD